MIDKNTLLIEYTSRFNKHRNVAPPEIKAAFREALELFIDNPNDPHLRNHALKEKYVGYRSINVTDDYRALFKIRKDENQTIITFHILGTHKELYE